MSPVLYLEPKVLVYSLNVIYSGDSYSSPYQNAEEHGSGSSDSEYDDSASGAAIDSSNTAIADSSEPPRPHKWVRLMPYCG